MNAGQAIVVNNGSASGNPSPPFRPIVGSDDPIGRRQIVSGFTRVFVAVGGFGAELRANLEYKHPRYENHRTRTKINATRRLDKEIAVAIVQLLRLTFLHGV